MNPIVVFILLAALGQVDARAEGDEPTRAFDIEREVEQIARTTDLWPGYDPLVIPLAVYTGDHTYLFRHRSPPEGFEAIPGHTAYRLAGRHPAVTSNSSKEIGGVPTATLLAAGQRADLSSTDYAAIALHEAFHVYVIGPALAFLLDLLDDQEITQMQDLIGGRSGVLFEEGIEFVDPRRLFLGARQRF